jgi:LPPG:FO 2-phospho-L-lactate transferase
MIRITAFAGGVGGAKLVDGLARVLPPEKIKIIVNIGDDFDHLGLRICPDIDTVCYTLAGNANPETGWGRDEETWNVMDNLVRLGGPGWFRLGDKDLATHLERTRLLAAGVPLSEITQQFCQAWGIRQKVIPASDQRVPTYVDTDEGEMPFQEYFVRHRCQPRVRGFRFENVERSLPAPGALEAIQQADVVVICPSNPWVSIDPILAIPGIRQLIARKAVLAVSPIIGDQAVKGPAAKMFRELEIVPSAFAVARHYGAVDKGGILSGFVLDRRDEDQIEPVRALGLQTLSTETWMKTMQDRHHLAEKVFTFSKYLSTSKEV